MSTLDLSQMLTPRAWDDVAAGYRAFVSDHLRLYADDALKRLSVSPGERIVDVATGPGTLSLPAARITQVWALDFSEGMLENLRSQATDEELANLTLTQGDGQALPYDDGSFQAAFSMFGLFMFPDRARGFSELYRVLEPGGRALVASWHPPETIPAFAIINQEMMELAEPLDANAPPGANEQPLSNADTFRREMAAAGFDVTIEANNHSMELPDLNTMWSGLSEAHVALVMAKKQLPKDAFASLLKRIEDRLRKELGEGPQTIEMPAWFGIGHKS